MNLNDTAWKSLLDQFPEVDFAFAYGSNVIQQGTKPSSGSSSSSTTSEQIDLIFAVDDSLQWHSSNLYLNPSHYKFPPFFYRFRSRTSPLQALSPFKRPSSLHTIGSTLSPSSASPSLLSRAITAIQGTGAGVYYNPYVKIEVWDGTKHIPLTIKYGVVDVQVLCTDLLTWNTLFLAGRLHKPVRVLVPNTRVGIGMESNLYSAVAYALLMLPNRFTEQQLYETIANISYTGDPRMSLGAEPSDKIARLVNGSPFDYRELYYSVVSRCLRKEDNREYMNLLKSNSATSNHQQSTQEHSARIGDDITKTNEDQASTSSTSTSTTVTEYKTSTNAETPIKTSSNPNASGTVISPGDDEMERLRLHSRLDHAKLPTAITLTQSSDPDTKARLLQCLPASLHVAMYSVDPNMVPIPSQSELEPYSEFLPLGPQINIPSPVRSPVTVPDPLGGRGSGGNGGGGGSGGEGSGGNGKGGNGNTGTPLREDTGRDHAAWMELAQEANQGKMREIMKQATVLIVKGPAQTQAIKGLVSGGAFRYALSKFIRAWK